MTKASEAPRARRRSPARDKLLAAAARLFYAHGVSATGIDAITSDAGVARMSLYHNFASKDDLVLAYLHQRHEEWLGLYRARAQSALPPQGSTGEGHLASTGEGHLASTVDPGEMATAGTREASNAEPRALAGVTAVFDAYLDHANLAYEHGFRGCGLLNAAAELPAGSPGRAAVRQHKQEVEAILLDHLSQAPGLTGAAREDLARLLSFLLEGAMSRAGLEGSDQMLRQARAMARQLISHTISPGPASPHTGNTPGGQPAPASATGPAPDSARTTRDTP